MSFQTSYDFVLGLEKGIHNPTPNDPNPTKDGVTQRTYSAHFTGDVMNMTDDERTTIYRSFYNACGAGLLDDDKVSAIQFAFAFNTNPHIAIMILQETLGELVIDGIIGPKTLFSINALNAESSYYYKDTLLIT